MVDDGVNAIGAMPPAEAWAAMSTTPGAMLVDVRTQAEWAFVGIADTSAIGCAQCFAEWTTFPASTRNPDFLQSLEQAVEKNGAKALFFLCRSGGRSHDAATMAIEHFSANGRDIPCINVLEGFEGAVDSDGHRGTVGGWKAHGLPWRQA